MHIYIYRCVICIILGMQDALRQRQSGFPRRLFTYVVPERISMRLLLFSRAFRPRSTASLAPPPATRGRRRLGPRPPSPATQIPPHGPAPPAPRGQPLPRSHSRLSSSEASSSPMPRPAGRASPPPPRGGPSEAAPPPHGPPVRRGLAASGRGNRRGPAAGECLCQPL